MRLSIAALPTPRVAGFYERPETSIQHAVEIEEKFEFKVLGQAGEHPASGRVIQLMGRRLMAQVYEYLKPDTCVRIDCKDTFLLGEILTCWREGPTTFAEVELVQALTGLKELATLGAQYLDRAKPLKPELVKEELAASQSCRTGLLFGGLDVIRANTVCILKGGNLAGHVPKPK